VRIALLSGASSIHTIRWANGLSEAGQEVHVISQHPCIEPFASGVKVHLFPFRGVAGYFTMVPAVRRLLRQIQPDIVNAHYASGYGTTARLVAVRPTLLSVWGSDVYDFPYKSFLHKWLVQKNIMAADAVASTSHSMSEQTRCLAPQVGDIAITPFGVEMNAYSRVEPVLPFNDQLIIGTVKTMADIYGIDILIEAFSLLLKNLENDAPELAKKTRLRLVGGGPQTEQLQQLAENLGVGPKVDFVGRVSHANVPSELAKLDIYVALSRIESFGVAIIEAGAARRPVVVSDVGGLPEVVINGTTGLVVPRDNPQAAANAIEKLVLNPQLRRQMGEAGRQHVQEKYSWGACIGTMLNVFENTVQRHREN
tara:strand:- start:237 stop:1337 length:1101 start_codon:yes stop_codon:yes gene_type:complete